MNGREFVLSSLAAMLVIGGALAVFRPATGESEDVHPGYWIEKLQAPEGTYDIVIVGDSRAYRGLDPSRLPAKVLNFGFSGAALDPLYVHTAVQKLRPGGSLVVAVSPHSLTARAREANAFDALQARHAADLALTRWASPAYAWTRPYTMSQVAALARGRAALLAPASPFETFHPGGFVASARARVESAPETARIYSEMLEAHPVGEREIMDLAYILTRYLASRYRVVVLRLPVSADVAEAEQLDNTWLKEQIVGTGLDWFECPPGDTYDGSHLTAESAREVTEALAGFLAE
jgi:hypothetical protein